MWSPRGDDGYPARVWDKDTGAINRTVARHWIENWDLVERMRRDWSSGLGEKLRGKLHIFAGADDTFFLDNAVMDAQAPGSRPALGPFCRPRLSRSARWALNSFHCRP